MVAFWSENAAMGVKVVMIAAKLGFGWKARTGNSLEYKCRNRDVELARLSYLLFYTLVLS